MKLFEYAVIFVPTEKEGKSEAPAIVVAPTTVLAKDANAANMIAIRAIPSTYDSKLDQVQVAVRPF